MASIRLGPFRLGRALGKGAMGIVYAGEHAEQRVPVAIKVLRTAEGDPTELRVLKNEVYAVARLDHPHVVMVLDHGEVSEEAAARSEGRLVAGTPYLVMERAGGGALDQIRAPCSWPTVYETLLALLDALAHAHARGVVHRDLKPGNVLLCTDEDLRPGLKLTDFGLAQHLSPGEGSEGLFGGTPLFMAPEQFTRGSREVGPRSDLYALGCLAFWLVSGRPPFLGSTWEELKTQHRRAPLPALKNTAPGPPGLEDWLRRLLEKEPGARYACAADAAFSLTALDPARRMPAAGRLPVALTAQIERRSSSTPGDATEGGEVWSEGAEEMASAPTVTSHKGGEPAEPLSALPTLLLPQTADEVFTRGAGAERARPPLPASWRTPSSSPPDYRLVGAGLGLYGLRSVPVVGREEERERLWSTLRLVDAEEAGQALVLQGTAGVGKSRLCEWLAQRAAEVGAAIPLRASFARIPGPGDGLGRLVSRHLRLWGLSLEEAAARADGWRSSLDEDARALIDPEEVFALALAHEGAPAFSSAAERHAALYRFVRAVAGERPALLWLDDAQWSADALDFARALLAMQGEAPAPILVVVTLNETDLGSRPAEQERLAALLDEERGHSLPLGPLPQQEHGALIERLLGLESSLADEVRQRTEGNPLFAVHLVGDWVERGLLETTSAGFALKAGVRLDLPDELHQLWGRRLEGALPEQDREAARAAVEVAAVLGTDVDELEYREALAAAGLPEDPALLDRAVTHGLLVRRPGGFTFAHAMIRSSAERSAWEGGRLATWHQAAAEALHRLYGDDALGVTGRLGRHLVAAGRPGEALAPLLTGAHALIEVGELLDAEGLLSEWRRARDQLGLDEGDRRVVEADVARARVLEKTGRTAEALRRSRSCEERAAALDQGLLGAARLVVADALATLGHLDEAADTYRAARRAFEEDDGQASVGLALLGLGHVEYYQGKREASERRYRRATALLERLGRRRRDLLECLWSLSYIELWRGALDESRALFRRMRTLARQEGDRAAEANAINGLGELARRQGKLEKAAERYREAARIAAACGNAKRHIFRLNLAHTDLALGRHDAASRLAEEVQQALDAAGDRIGACAARWILAACAGHRGDFVAFDRRVAAAVTLVGEEVLVDDDLAQTARLAGDVARRAGAYESAAPAYRFARELYARLGAEEPMRELDRTLQRLAPR